MHPPSTDQLMGPGPTATCQIRPRSPRGPLCNHRLMTSQRSRPRHRHHLAAQAPTRAEEPADDAVIRNLDILALHLPFSPQTSPVPLSPANKYNTANNRNPRPSLRTSPPLPHHVLLRHLPRLPRHPLPPAARYVTPGHHPPRQPHHIPQTPSTKLTLASPL